MDENAHLGCGSACGITPSPTFSTSRSLTAGETRFKCGPRTGTFSCRATAGLAGPAVSVWAAAGLAVPRLCVGAAASNERETLDGY